VLRELPVEDTAAGAGVSERTVKRARAGQRVGTDARERLTNHVIRHARAQLRAASTRPSTDPEAILATYHDRPNAPTPEPGLCACGSGQPIKRGRRGPASKWHTDACRKRAARRHAGHG